MTRFKGSLQGKYYAPPAPSHPNKVHWRDSVLHEGFALPVPERPAALPTEVEAVVAPRQGPEARPCARGSLDQAMQFASSPEACRLGLLEETMASTSKGPIASRIKLWEQLGKGKQSRFPFHSI